jgi:PAS domain S-box-containing protein
MVESVVQSHAEIVVDSTEKLKIRVLHVDDELGLLKVAKQCLELQGPFHVDTAGSVEEALNKLKEKEYDAVVSDYVMPGKDGLEFLEVLRKSGSTIPFVMFTGKGREEVAVKAWSLGADHYVNRTGDPGTIYCELAHNIRQAVEKKRALEMRNVCQQRFLCLVENAAAGVGIFDPQGRFTYVNDALANLLGYPARELAGRHIGDFLHKEDKTRILESFRQFSELETEPPTLEFRAVRKDGRLVYLMAKPTKSEINGKIVGSQAIIVDITERKQVEQELRRFSVAVRTSLDGVISGDLNGNITDVNEAALRMYGGTDKSDLIGKNVIDLLAERDRTRALHDSMESMKIGQGKTVEYCALTKSGIEVPIEITTAFLKEERGEPTGFVDIIRNITGRKKAELDLKESEARYRSLVEQSLAGIIIAQGPAVHAVFVNKAMTDIWGYTAEEFYSLSQRQIEKMIYPEDRSLFFKSFEDRLKGKNVPSRYEFRALRKDGNVIWLEICAGLIEYNGRPAVQGIFTDITERRTAEEALHESMESHKELAESISDMFFAMDKDFRYTYWNKASEELTGISAKDAIGKSLTEVFPDVKGTGVEQFYKEVLRTQQPQSYLNKYQLRGKDYVFELNAYPTKTGLSVFVKDITERKKAEQTLHASLDRYRSFIEVTGELGWTTNADGEVVEDIPSFRKFTGQTYEEVEGWGWSKALHPDDLECTTRIWKEATRTKSKYEVEYRLRRHDGVYRYFMARGVPVFEEGGSIREWVGTCIDITERKAMEKALLQSQQKFEQLFMSNPEAAVYVDPSERVLNVNPRFTELFGYSADEVNGRFLDDFVVPEDRKKEALMLAQKGKEGYFYYETYRKNRKGSLIPVAISTAPIMFKGQHPGDIVLYKDITERKKAEEELCRAMEKLELANEKLRVVGGLTRHDVRNKLSAITGNIYLNKKRLADHPDVLESYVDMESACEQIVRIFDFAKDYEMLGVEELVYVDVEKIVNEAASFFSDLRGVKVANECHGLTVLADSLLRQLFYNLIDNSLKHGERPTRIRIHCEKTDGDQLKLVYEDDGIGISLDAKPKIFAGGYTTGKGSGYGLYLVKKMMEVYGWTIQETGTPGKGARFTITIPKTNRNGKENYRIV